MARRSPTPLPLLQGRGHTTALLDAKASPPVRSRPKCWSRRRSSPMAFVDHRTDRAPVPIHSQSFALGGDCLQAKTPSGPDRVVYHHLESALEDLTERN